MFVLAVAGVLGCAGAASGNDTFIETMNARFSGEKLPVEDRPQVRWWLDQAYHTDETLRKSVQALYDLGYGGMEILCLSNNTTDNSVYGWGTEEWRHDLEVLVETAGKLGMNVDFAAGPDWQPTFLYYGTNANVAGNRSWKDYYQDYDILRKNGLKVLEAAYGDGKHNVYKTQDGTLAIDPNVDVFNQGLGLGYTIPDTSEGAGPGETVTKTVKYVKAGGTVEIDLTRYTYVPGPSRFGSPAGGPGGPPQMEGGMPEGRGGPGGAGQMGGPPMEGGGPGGPEGGVSMEGMPLPDGGMPGGTGGPEGGGGEPGSSGKQQNRTRYTLSFDNFETISLARAANIDDVDNIGEEEGKALSLAGVTQFTPSQLTVGTPDSLITHDAKKGTYTFRWTAPADDPDAVYALTPAWRVGVGHGTGSDTHDYGYMLMMNHFSTAGADAIFAFWRTYLLTDEMVGMLRKYQMEWDWFIDSLEIGRLGNYYWSNEMSGIFQERNGYDVTPYLPMLFDDSYSFEGIDADAVRNDMTNAMTEAYILFQQRLSDNLATAGGALRAQVSYGAALTTSPAIRAVDVPETESLAFKMSVEAMKLMSGGVHLSGAREFSSETTNWIGVDNASYVDQAYAVHQQMSAGVNRTVWHGFEAEAASKKGLSWPNSSVGIGSMFGSYNIPTSVLEPEFSYHITLLQHILKTGTETVDVGIMQNDYYPIDLRDIGDDKGLLTRDHSLQNAGYTWECFDSSYLWAEDGRYGFQNADGSLGNPMYRAIVVWDEDLSLDAAEALLKLVENGMNVVFLTDKAAATTGSLAADDTGLAGVIAQVKSQGARVKTVDSTEEIVGALREMGVMPRMALVDAVATAPNKTMLAKSGGEFRSYDGLWTAMMRNGNANYYYVFNDSPDYQIATSASFEGEFTPYVVDTWSGQVRAVAQYRVDGGRTELDMALAPNDVAVYILRKGDTSDRLHVLNTDADFAAMADDGSLSVGAVKSGEYHARLSDGRKTASAIETPAVDWNGAWQVAIESWTRGDQYTVTETRDNIDPYTGELFTVEGSTRHTATEYGYGTKKEIVFDGVIANDAMVPWKGMQAAGLSKIDLTAVSGVGTYTTSFTLPGQWNEANGIRVDLGKIDGMTGVTVNGRAFRVDIVSDVVDISPALKAGENELVVKVATSTTNYLTGGRERTARAFPDNPNPLSGPDFYKELPASYGLTEPVKLVPYALSVVK